MAAGNLGPNDDPNRLDINLSLLPGESELAINSLVAQLRAISAQLAVIQAPDSGAAVRAQLLAFQQTGLPTHGISASASVPSLTPSGIAATMDAQKAREHAQEAERDRREELQQRRDQAEEARRRSQEQRDQAQQAAEEARQRQEELREIQAPRYNELYRQEYAASHAQNLIETSGLRRGMRFLTRNRLDLNIGRPSDLAPFTPEEEQAALSRITPPEYLTPSDAGPLTRLRARGGRAVNRLLQINTPESRRQTPDEMASQARVNAYSRLQEEVEGAGMDMAVEPPNVRSTTRGGPSVPPNTRIGDDGLPEPQPVAAQNTRFDIPEDAPAWMTHVSREYAGSPMVMPRIGEFTVQDTLNMMAQMASRRAYDSYDTGGQGTGNTFGNTAALLQRSANAMPYLANLQGNLARRGFNVSTEDFRRIAYLQGVDRPTDISMNLPGLGHVAVMNPLTAARASVKGAAILGDIATAGTSGSYLSTGQAFSLGGEMIGRGFTREQTLQALRGPIGHIRGGTYLQLEPGEIIDAWQKAILAGGESMSQFTQVMSDVVPAARSARMNVEEFNASADQLGETFQNLGGTYVGGRRAANQFSLLTGMAPQVLQQTMQNQLVQGITFGQTGILPQLQGMLPGSMLTQQSTNTLGMLVNLFRGGLSNQHVAVPGGHMTISAEDQAIALAGQQLGLDREAAFRLYHQQRNISRLGPAQSALDAYQQDIERARNRTGGSGPAFRRAVNAINAGRGNSRVSRQDIADALNRAGFNGDAIALRHEGTGIQDALSAAERDRFKNIYDKQSGSGRAPNVQVAIELRGEAKKMFDAHVTNGPANQSKAKRNAGYQGDDWVKGLVPEQWRDWASSAIHDLTGG